MIRLTKALSVCLILLLSIGVVAGLGFVPYHVLGKLVFDIEIYSEMGQASFVNVTFFFDKLFPIGEGQTSITRTGSLAVPDPNGTFQMQLNMTLKSGESTIKTPTKTVEFLREGEYLLIVPYSFDNLRAGTYQLVIAYSGMFDQRRAFWTVKELYVTVS